MMTSGTASGRVAEVFYSIQGEGATAGTPAVFARLQGCTVGCAWCDTKYSWDADAGRAIGLDALLAEMHGFPSRRAVVTGRAPLRPAWRAARVVPLHAAPRGVARSRLAGRGGGLRDAAAARGARRAPRPVERVGEAGRLGGRGGTAHPTRGHPRLPGRRSLVEVRGGGRG